MDTRSVRELGWRALAAAQSRLGFAALYPGRADAVLMFHAVGGTTGNEGRHLSVSRLRALLRWADERYEFVDLPAVLDAPPDRPRLALTFDDAYRSLVTRALPVLREFDAPATAFVIADRVGGETERGVPHADESELAALADGDLVALGNHTRSHVRLSECAGDALRAEVLGARDALEDRFGVDVDRFCYPYADYSAEALALVRESHALAVAGDGLVRAPVDPHLVPRVDGSLPPAQVRWELTTLADDLRRRLA